METFEMVCDICSKPFISEDCNDTMCDKCAKEFFSRVTQDEGKEKPSN